MARGPQNAVGVFPADPTTGDPSGSFGGGAVGSIAATTPTITRVASSAANVANGVALNTGRLGLWIQNESTGTLYIKCGSVAAVTDYSLQIPPGIAWEMPANPRYTGRIDFIWDVANGFAQVTEFTA